jgi:hypothetical protein
MTTPVTVEEASAATEEEFLISPTFAQEEIVKDFELRVIWINGVTVAFRINSQDYKTTKTDWRYSTDALNFEPFDLSADTSAKIDCFMRNMGLFCGALDFIVDKSGGFWFLECNQQGAWGWLDARQGGRIRRVFAEQIASVAAIG